MKFLRRGDSPADTGLNLTRELVERPSLEHCPALSFIDSMGVIERFDYGEVARRATRWAGLLAECGIRRGDRVVVAADARPDWRLAFLGIIKAGAIAVPVRASEGPLALRTAYAHCGASVAVTATRVPELEDLGLLPVDELRARLDLQPLVAETADTDPSDFALITYRGLSAGSPLGAVHTHGSCSAQVEWSGAWLGARQRERVWCSAEPGSAESLWNLLTVWGAGAELVVNERELEAEERVELIDGLRVGILWIRAAEYAAMAEFTPEPWQDLSTLRRAVSTDTAVEPAVDDAFREKYWLPIRQAFGTPESGVLTAALEEAESRSGTVGQPLPGHDVAIVDEEGRDVPPGSPGELVLRGQPASLFAGYWDDDRATKAVFRKGAFRTRMTARLDDAGHVQLLRPAEETVVALSDYRAARPGAVEAPERSPVDRSAPRSLVPAAPPAEPPAQGGRRSRAERRIDRENEAIRREAERTVAERQHSEEVRHRAQQARLEEARRREEQERRKRERREEKQRAKEARGEAERAEATTRPVRQKADRESKRERDARKLADRLAEERRRREEDARKREEKERKREEREAAKAAEAARKAEEDELRRQRKRAEQEERERLRAEAERQRAEDRAAAEQREWDEQRRAAQERERAEQEQRRLEAEAREAERRAREAERLELQERAAAEHRAAEQRRREEEAARREAERAAEERARREQAERERTERAAAERAAAEERARREQAAREQAEREAAARAAEERARREQAEREAAQRAAAEEQARREQAAREQAEREAAQRAAAEEQARREQAEREQAEREAEAAARAAAEERARREQAAREQAEREAAERTAAEVRARREREAAEAERARRDAERAAPERQPARAEEPNAGLLARIGAYGMPSQPPSGEGEAADAEDPAARRLAAERRALEDVERKREEELRRAIEDERSRPAAERQPEQPPRAPRRAPPRPRARPTPDDAASAHEGLLERMRAYGISVTPPPDAARDEDVENRGEPHERAS